MKQQTEQPNVIVVGGGMAGLTAACYLARAGIAVTVYEKASKLGGRGTTQDYDGYKFNRGIHALYTGGAASEVLQELGIPYTGHSPKGIYALHQGRLYVAPINMATMLSTQLFSLAEKLELMGLFTSLPRLNPADFSNVSVQDWLDRTIRHSVLRQFMAANARTFVYSSALDLVSAEVFINKMQISLKHPVVYIDGGWQSLVDNLRKEAESHGVHILTDARVEAVKYQDNQVQGVQVRAVGLVPASAVIIATNPQDAVKLVDNGQYSPLRHIVDGLVPAQLACLDVALHRLPDPRYPVVQDIDGPRFMSAQSQFSKVAPDNGALIYTFKQLDPTHLGDPHDDERDLEALLDAAQPGWRDVLVKRTYLPRIDAIGALPTVSTGGFAGRPGPEVPNIKNLFVAGDWIGYGFLVDAGMESARRVAKQIIHSQQVMPAATAV